MFERQEDCDGEVVTPGEVLGDALELIPGKGAYTVPHSNKVYAAVVGRRKTVISFDSDDKRPTVEVISHKAQGAVPDQGATVLARVKKVTTKMATTDIMCVGTHSVREKFSGVIRQQDVRATEIDKVDMYSSFHPGDVVRALVLSLGDARAYYLSTAKPELGVVYAESTTGEQMKAISATEMQCPSTEQIQHRKVALLSATAKLV